MSARYLGGVIAQTQLPLNPAAGNAANGVFTLNQYMQAVKNATWPSYDPYFKQNVLLLHGNGTNGAQNNTFLDSSTNNFTITRNGNTTQGTFSPFSLAAGEWSNYFDGNGDFLQLANSTALQLGGGAFTIEAWIYPTASGTYRTIISKRAGGTAEWEIGLNNTDNKLYFYTSTLTPTSNQVTLNAWNHVAASFDGTTLRLYINGVEGFSGTNTVTNSTNITRIGAVSPFTADFQYFPGYISNVRVVKGTAVYTSNFTPPTTPLTAITNTSLLTCQSNRFVDNSTNAFAITANGDVKVTPFSPFAPTAAYSAGTNGGSGYFDGSGDYLNLGGQSAFAFGTGDWTIEFWIYATSSGGTLFDTRPSGTASTNGYGVIFLSSGTVRYDTAAAVRITGSISILNTWTHVAVCKASGTTRLFINGVQDGSSYSDSTNYLVGANRPIIGADGNNPAAVLVTGYFSNYRILKGTGLYTSNFTPPTAPLTAISNTSLLCNFTNAGIIDNTSKNNLETVGNAQIDTAVKKFGDGSLEFDGNGDFLSIFATAELQLTNASAFTIEFWVYAATLPSIGGSAFIIRAYNMSSPFQGYGIAFGGNTANTNLQFWNGTTWADIGTVSTTTWTHVAIAYEGSGSTLRYFINGTQQGSATTVPSSINWTGTQFILGARNSDFYFNGYIDDLRITKGVARYTSNFAVPYLPQGPLPLVGGPYIPNTVLMLPGTGTNGAQNNTFLDSSTNNFTITRNGNTTQGTFSPFSRANGYWGNFFVNTYINTASVAGFAFGTGDYTIEGWVYPVTTKSAMRFIQFSDNNDNIDINVTNTGSLNYYNGTTSTTSAGNVLTINAWNHIAIVRSSGTVRGYANGVQVLTQATTPNTTANRIIYIGGVTNQLWEGYISNVRVVKGTAVYTSNFTPTGPLTAIANTSLLTCQSNRFIDNSTSALAITRNGDVRIATFSPFEYLTAYSPTTNGGSGYFDGNGDALSAPNDTAFDFSTGDFTVECWVYMFQYNTGQYQPIFQNAFLFYTGDAGGAYIFNGSTNVVSTATGVVPINTWVHLAFVRSGSGTNNTKIYVNGVQEGQATVTAAIGSGNPNLIGNRQTIWFPGYISNLRVVKGTAVYTSNFTPPTSPVTAISGTSLLCNFTNAGIYDASMTNDLETVGNAQVSTTQSKWGGGSMYFDGSGDYLVSPHVADFEFGSGNFTIEFWAYANAISGAYTGVVGVWQGGASATANSWLVLLNCFNATNKFGFSYSTGSAAVDYVFDATTTTGSWNHYMVVRSGNTLYGFKNGVLLGFSSGTSAISGSITNGTQPLYIGTGGTASSGTDFNGYISDLRILKGVAILPTPLQTSQWQDQ